MIVVCKESVDLSTDKKTETLSKEEEIIICASCNHQVTTPSMQIIVNNSFLHIFVNPYGQVFEIGCFSDAKGCRASSMTSTEFSWFVGYSWKTGVCNNCLTHLGWIFSSGSNNLKNPHIFFGLILEKLIFP